jgi:hypothetical protein
LSSGICISCFSAGGRGHTIGLFDFRDLGLLPLFALALLLLGLGDLPPVVLQYATVTRFDICSRRRFAHNETVRVRVRVMREVQAAAQTLGLEVATLEVRRADDFAPAIEALKGSADALYVVTEPLANTNRVQINTLALGARLPTLQ